MKVIVAKMNNETADILKQKVKMVAPFVRMAIEEAMINKGLMTEQELKKIKERQILEG